MAAAPSRSSVAARLAEVGLFAGLGADVLDSLAGSVTPRSWSRGQPLFLEGDPGESLLVLTEGCVSVYRASPSGERAALALLRPPEVLGEIALLDGSRRSASAEAVEATTALALGRPAFLALVREQPALLEALLRSLGVMVRRLSDQAADHVFLDLAGRVAKALIRLAPPSPAGEPVSVEVTQGRLAELAGGTRQSVNQVLGTFTTRGLVRLEGRRVVLVDPAGLRRRARLPLEPAVPPSHAAAGAMAPPAAGRRPARGPAPPQRAVPRPDRGAPGSS